MELDDDRALPVTPRRQIVDSRDVVWLKRDVQLPLANLTKFVLIVELSEMVGVSSAAVDVELGVLGLVEVAVQA